jgi:hypothetical protein
VRKLIVCQLSLDHLLRRRAGNGWRAGTTPEGDANVSQSSQQLGHHYWICGHHETPPAPRLRALAFITV